MILVTGASGNVGRQVVEQLLAAGQQVRALSRDPGRHSWPDGVETVAGDLATGVPASAFEGVDGLFLFPSPQGVAEVLAAASAAGVRHVAVLSSMSAAYEGDSPLRKRHTDVEEAVEASGIGWTHLRPGMFATNTLQWAAGIRSEGVVRQPYPESAAATIHEADIAAVAVAALLDPGAHAGQAYVLTGPESVTQAERARLIGEAIGKDVRFEELTREQARAGLLSAPYMTDALADTLLDMLAELTVDNPAAGPLPDLERVLGRPGRTFAEWAADHRADFA